MNVRLGGLLSVAGVALALAACTGGGGNSPVPVTVTPAVAPTGQATQAAVTTAGGAIALGSVGNGKSTVVNSVSVTLPALSAAGTVAASLSASAPTAVPTPNAVKRRPADLGGLTNTPIAYLTLTFAQNETITSTPALTISVPSLPITGNAYLVVYSSALPSGWAILSGPITAAGTMTFPSTTMSPLTLQAGVPYVFAIIVSSSTPTALNPLGGASYTGTKTVAFSYGYAFGFPAPAPSATAPPSSMTYAVTSTVSIGSSPNPVASASSAFDEHTVENDASSLSTTTLASDAWVANGVAGSSPNGILLYAQTQSEPSSANEPVITTSYNAAQVLDELPETNGASWSNSPASTVAYSYASGNNGTRTVGADGTYTDTENLLAGGVGGTAVLTENNDGSGTLSGPFFGGGIIDNVAISAPTAGNVAVTFNYSTFAQTNYGYPPSSSVQDPTWYPTPSPLSFYGESDAVATAATLPASCTPNGAGTTATDVKRTITQLDTVIGFVETTTFDSYNAGGMPVCLVTNDVINYAYDWQNNTPYLLFVGINGGFAETQTTTESLILQSGVGPLPTLRKNAVSSNASASNGFLLALESHQLAGFARDRARHERQFIQNARNQNTKPTARSNQGGR